MEGVGIGLGLHVFLEGDKERKVKKSWEKGDTRDERREHHEN